MQVDASGAGPGAQLRQVHAEPQSLLQRSDGRLGAAHTPPYSDPELVNLQTSSEFTVLIYIRPVLSGAISQQPGLHPLTQTKPAPALPGHHPPAWKDVGCSQRRSDTSIHKGNQCEREILPRT